VSAIHGQPPGRAGRVWLRHRHDVAQRGAGLLETKLRILAAEEQRFSLLVARTERRWTAAVADAEVWMRRAVLVSGQRGLRFAADAQPADVSLTWVTTMGVHYPEHARVSLPEPAPDASTPDNSALVQARSSYRDALEAAAAHAVATEALRAVQTEVLATRRRLRAIEKRWLPRLDEAQRRLGESLEEQEREDGVRMRREVARRSGAQGDQGPGESAPGGRQR
jgi:V/A-type H+-transporting ATPase subunit D